MDAAPSGIRSFDELAKSCLKSNDWPASTSVQPRSLGAILGRLDRGEGTDWLAGRAEVQQALAQVLGVQRGALLVALNPKRASKAERWVTWQAMPFARGLDLTGEGLFPGIPELVLQPGRWDRLIWVAPNGGGRSLTGQWLEARGLATHHAAATLELEHLPPVRPLLVELASDRIDASRLGPGLCLAVPEPWEPPSGFGDCVVVRSPPIRELVEPVVRWARDRLAESSTVSASRLASRVLTLVELGWVESVGDVLGLVGLADAEGTEVIEPRALERAAREWLRRQARERLDPEAAESGWFKKSGFEALVRVAGRVAIDGAAPLFFPRPVEKWSGLVPEDLRHGPDLEWMKVALPNADPSLRPAAIERASEKLPPGAFRLVRCFEHTGVLERDDMNQLVLRPHWLARVAMHEALGTLVAGPAFDWGEALLSPAMAAATMDRLVERARARTLPIEELVDPPASSEAGYAAAIEGAVRALGAAELLGVHAGGDALETLFDEQLRLSVELPDALVRPRIEHAPKPGQRGTFWLSRGAWHLALLAVGEALDGHQGASHPLLRPWQATEPPAGMSAVLDLIVAALEGPDAQRELVGPTVGLVTRLGALLGPLGARRTRHRLERAATLADEAAVGVLAWSSVAALEGDRLGILGLLALIEQRRLAHATLATEVWRAFESAGMPAAEVGILLTPELAPVLLPHAPAATLPTLLRGIAALETHPPLSTTQWQTLLAGDVSHVGMGLFRLVPEPALSAAVDAACRSGQREALGVLWSRFPDALTGALVEVLGNAEAAARRGLLLDTAPPSVTGIVVESLAEVEDLLRGHAANLAALRRFLHAQIGARGPGFRDAYALLDEIEEHLEDVRSHA